MHDIRVLTVQHFGETEEENTRITLSPLNIKMTAANPTIRQNREMFKVSVLFLEGDSVELFVTEMDLLQIERAVGMYGTAEF